MQELFGIPMGTLAAVLAAILAVVLGLVATLALRNRVFFKLGVRNVGRRRARTMLIVVGLMLGTTIIAAALTSGDTMSHTIRSASVESLGATDEVVAVKGAEIDPFTPLAESVGADYFPEALVPAVTRELLRTRFDAVTPAIVETVAVQDTTTRQSESRVTLFGASGPNLVAFGEIRGTAGRVSLDDLRPGEVFLNGEAADDLDASPGDRLNVLAGPAPTAMRVRDVVEFAGTGTTGPSVLVSLATAQALLNRPGEVRYVLVSNIGGPTEGVVHTDEVAGTLAPTLARLGLELTPIKRDALEAADAQGNAFMTLFTTFGSFSILAGILLIFLIFVMLAAERRGELGIARAIGTRRGHLIQMYLHEGMTYDLLAAAVGAALGVAVAFGMVLVLSSALGAQGVAIEHDFQPRSIVVAYSLGVLLTFVVVTFSAWRVSRMNIATAVRNLPEPSTGRQRRHRWIGGVALIGAGAALVASGIASADAMPFVLGVALLLFGAVPVTRAAGLPERIAYTAAGVSLVVFCLLPFDWYDALAGGTELKMSFAVWIVSGLLMVVGTAWTIVYNADLLLGTLTAVAGRVRSLTPVLRMAIAHPMRNRFRTGITLAMFTLVVFTLVVGAAVSGSFTRAFSDVETFGGGWDVRATASAVVPLRDPNAAVANSAVLDGSRYEQSAAMSFLPVQARQLGTSQRFEDYPVRGVDEAFAARTTYRFGAKARGYPDPWRALASEPGLAVVDSFAVARLDDFTVGAVLPEFQLEGFYLEDGVFDPVQVAVRDPKTGRTVELEVIGVLTDAAPYDAVGGITTSQATLEAAFGDRVQPTIFFFALAPGVDPRVEAGLLESTFLRNGLEADALEEVLEDAMATSSSFNRVIQGFMGLGLVVGVAALGVISARAVVERRQQIGILRAIGYRRRMIQLSFLLESSFIALTAIASGTALGLVCSRNIVADVASQPSYEHLTLSVPWLDLAIVFAVVYVVALATTLAPAVRASRIYPAQALRYQ